MSVDYNYVDSVLEVNGRYCIKKLSKENLRGLGDVR